MGVYRRIPKGLFHHTDLDLWMNIATGKNKAFITRETNIQRTKYGNQHVFECWVDAEKEEVTLYLGESYGRYVFNHKTQTCEHIIGNIYKPKQCQSLADEIGRHHFGKIIIDGIEYERRNKHVE